MNLATRNERIDFLRGIAILLVLLLHFRFSFDIKNTFFAVFIPENLLHAFTINGNYGVTMFYVISGYLITLRSLQRYGRLDSIRPFNFYQLRCAKIFPGLILALTLVNLLALLPLKSFANKPDTTSMWLTNFSALTFWYNILLQKIGGYFNYATTAFWSLSVEEVFYLLFPIVCIVAKRKSHLFLIASVLIIFCTTFRYLHRDNELFFIYDYFACFDAIAIGCLAAILKNESYDIFFQNRFTQLLAAIALCTTYLIGIHGNETFGFTVISSMTAILILSSDQRLIPQNIPIKMINKCIGFIGRISYELYLYHLIVLGLLRDFFRSPKLGFMATNILFCAFILVSLSIAFLCHYYFTEPLNRKIRNFRSPTTAVLEAKC